MTTITTTTTTELFGGCMKILLIAILALTSSISHAYNNAALMDAYFGVVLIRGYNQTGGMAYGSGVVVNDNQVITNCHVLRATSQPWVTRGEDTYPITDVRADAWHDLCLVSTHNMPFKPVLRGDSLSLKRGQDITAIGHSNGVPAPITSLGEIQGLYPSDQGNVIRSSAKFLMGASGSGLFDMEGRLVGINTFKTAGSGGSVHFALPVEWLSTLEKMPASTTFPVVGKALWEEDEDKKPLYMQAAVPESRQDWPALAKVAQTWIDKETNNADAWFSLGLAEEHLLHPAAALKAFAKAATLAPQFVEALFKQGEIAKKTGDLQTVEQVQTQLNAIDPQLLPVFQQYLACTNGCKTR